MDSNEMRKEKPSWEFHKNAMCCLEIILEEATHKAAVVQPFASHLTNDPNKTNKTCRAFLEK